MAGISSGTDLMSKMFQYKDKTLDMQKKRWENLNKMNDTATKSYDSMVDKGVQSIGFKLSAGGQ